MKKIFSYIILLLFLGLTCCVEPFAIKNVSYTDILVVDGFISTDVKQHRVALSRTTLISERKFIPEVDAQLLIRNGKGEIITLTETEPGLYDTPEIGGAVGERYQLLITTSNGREYQSSEVKLRSTPGIGKIYGRYLTNLPNGEKGIQIYVDTEDQSGSTNYFRWDYIETYEVQAPFASNYEWLGGNNYKFRNLPVGICYPSDTLKNVLIKTTAGLDQSKVSEFPVRFIPAESYIMRIRYSILLRQYSLSAEAYSYWENLRTINESQGSLYDAQPGIIRGNLFSITDIKETVLGYFDASEVSQQRVFFSPVDFQPFGYRKPDFQSSCRQLLPELVPLAQLGEYMELNKNKVLIWDAIGMEPNALFEMLPIHCCDCTSLGTNIKPSFW